MVESSKFKSGVKRTDSILLWYDCTKKGIHASNIVHKSQKSHAKKKKKKSRAMKCY